MAGPAPMTLRDLYPPLEPYASGRMAVDAIHTLYWEECGNPHGLPVLFLHGGPGGGCSATSRRFFDPVRFRIVLFDQRGAGRSTPHGELRENTTAHLVADIEALRRLRGIEAWHVFGGSWGSTLALAYAEESPQHCLSLTLRGIFLMRRAEIRWLFEAGRLFRPEALQALLEPLEPSQREVDPLEAYALLLDHPDPATRRSAARRWSVYEATLANLIPDATRLAEASQDHVAHAMARIEVHYFRNNCYDPDDWLLRRIERIRHVPGAIVQGRYDLLCPPASALDLHAAWPEAELHVIENAGHSATETATRSCLVSIMDRIAAGEPRLRSNSSPGSQRTD